MLLIRAGIPRILVRTVNREDFDKAVPSKQSDLSLQWLSMHFGTKIVLGVLKHVQYYSFRETSSFNSICRPHEYGKIALQTKNSAMHMC